MLDHGAATVTWIQEICNNSDEWGFKIAVCYKYEEIFHFSLKTMKTCGMIRMPMREGIASITFTQF
jgi:hypothetical protein